MERTIDDYMVELSEHCPTCRRPLYLFHGVAMCWECYVNHKAVERARAVLARAQMAAKGLVITKDHAYLEEDSCL